MNDHHCAVSTFVNALNGIRGGSLTRLVTPISVRNINLFEAKALKISDTTKQIRVSNKLLRNNILYVSNSEIHSNIITYTSSQSLIEYEMLDYFIESDDGRIFACISYTYKLLLYQTVYYLMYMKNFQKVGVLSLQEPYRERNQKLERLRERIYKSVHNFRQKHLFS